MVFVLMHAIMNIGKLKSIEYYINLDRETAHKIAKDGRRVMDVWFDLAGPKVIGNMTKFYAETRPSSTDIFFQQYLRRYGSDRLIKVAEAYYQKIGLSEMTYEICYDLVVYHVIIQTIKGKKVEDWLSSKLKNNGFHVEQAKGLWDTDFNVDLFACNDGEVKAYIQVKPLSYFCGKTDGLTAARADAYRKEKEKISHIRKLRSEGRNVYTERPTTYMAYDYKSVRFSGNEITSIKWAYLGDKVKFKLSDICDDKGRAKHHLQDFTLKELVEK